MLRKLIFLTSFICVAANMQAQEEDWGTNLASAQFKAKKVIPPTPEAAALGKYGNLPMSLFTGTPNITVPIYQLAGNNISLPIQLSYNAGGFNPQEIAPWTGLGWSLSSGGVITRSISGNPDDYWNYFISPSPLVVPSQFSDPYGYYDYMENLRKGNIEAQPDMYYYNFAGNSGKFLVNPDGTFLKKEKNNYIITGNIPSTTGSNIFITDDQGVKYEFMQFEVSTFQTDDMVTDVPVRTFTYPSTWYLTRIVSADGFEEITFTYYTASLEHCQFSNYNQNQSNVYEETIPYSGSPSFYGPVLKSASTPVVKTKRKYIQQIDFKRAGQLISYIVFESTVDQRQDLDHSTAGFPGERLLNSIKVYTKKTGTTFSLTKQVNLNYSYFTNNNNAGWSFKRLRLDNVQEIPVIAGTTTPPPYTFEYNNDNLMPVLTTTSMDHWGFYNLGNGGGSLVPNTNTAEGNINITAENRLPSLTGSSSYLINKIKYPTGGYTMFEYELNKAKQYQGGPVFDVGGVRIKKITDYSFNTKKAQEKTYEYLKEDGTTSGCANVAEYLSVSSYNQYGCPPGCGGMPSVCIDDWLMTKNTYSVAANSVIGLGTIQGSHIGYSRVTESITDVSNAQPLGKTVYEYNVEGSWDPHNDDIGNGDLLKKSVYDNGGKLIQEVTNTYNYVLQGSIGAATPGMAGTQDNRSTLVKSNAGGGGYYYGWYMHPSCATNVVESRIYKKKFVNAGWSVSSKEKQLTQQFNGNITGLVWKSDGDDVRRKYDFSYDAANRLLQGLFEQDDAISSWNSTTMNYTTKMGDGSNATSAYDDNGNIKAMTQFGWKLGVVSTTPIDNLTYNYIPGSNKLLNVIDGNNDPQTKLGDFRTSILHPTQSKISTTVDYTYDVNGNLLRDYNKDIGNSSNDGIVYNHLNLPQTITVRTTGGAVKGTITYTYDATGNKLKKEVNETGQPLKTTLYVAGAVYENDVLQFIGHEEGRVRKSGAAFVYDYFIKDHLGNVRMVLTEEQKTDAYPAATMEPGTITSESTFYGNLTNTQYAKPSWFADPVYPDPNNTKVAQVKNSGSIQKIGPNIILKVMAGDTYSIRVASGWNSGSAATNSNTNVLTDLMSLLSSGLANASGGKATQTQLQNSSSGLNSALTNFLTTQTTSGTKPKAYINWILFDEQFKIVSSNSGFEQVGSSGATTIHVKSNLAINKSGYLYIYTSNDATNIDVFFDNLQVTHIRGHLVSEQHYYAFGLEMRGLSSSAMNFGSPGNQRYKYNGKEEQRLEFSDGSGLEWLDYGARMFDNQIGRWSALDPKGYLYFELNPYNFVANNPIRLVDPNGKEIIDGNDNAVKISDPVKNADGIYSVNYTFKEGTSKKVQKRFMNNAAKVINSAIQTEAGREVIMDAIKSENQIAVNISSDEKTKEVDESGQTKNEITLGETSIKASLINENGKETLRIQVTVYEGSISVLSGSDEGIDKEWRENNLTAIQKIGGVGVHEFTHATKHTDALTSSKGLSNVAHQQAWLQEAKAINEFGDINKKRKK